VDQFLDAKKSLGVDISASYKKIFPTLTKVMGDRSLGSLTSRELSAWLDQRHPNPVTRNTARKRIVTLWRWSRRQGYLPRDILTEAEQTDTAIESPKRIGVISGETYRRLLEHFRTNEIKYLAPLVLAGLCGLRRCEIHGQVWKDVEIGRALLHVTKAKRNTPAYRLVPIQSNAVAWLNLCPDREGDLCDDMAIDRIREIGREADFVLPKNCFRHSYISHRVAQTGDVATTSLEAGNSPEEIFRDYRELFSKSDGEAWFNILPKKP
jgi:integrase